MAPTTSVLETLPAKGETILRDGKPYILCPSCDGTRLAQIDGDPFCTDCFGAGISPLFDAARFAFARANAAGLNAPSLDAPVRNGGGNMEASRKGQSSVKAATEPQIDLLEKLLRERAPHADSLDDIARTSCRDALKTLRSIKDGKIVALRTMSDIITEVMAIKVPRTAPARPAEAPVEQAPVAPIPSCPEGKFALPTDDGDVKFYEVEHGKEGSKWEGFTFLAAIASDERYPIKNREAKAEILARIAADPLEAMKLYGIEIGACGHCGKTLTSKWRLVGIGPVCSKKVTF